MAKISKADAAIQQQITESLKQQQELEKIHMSTLNEKTSAEDRISIALDVQKDKLTLINELRKNYNSLSDEQKKQLEALTKEYNEQVAELKKLNQLVKEQKKNQDSLNKVVEKTSSLFAKGWEYLMQSDKVIKETTRNLGMSGTKASELRKSFELSAGNVARMGGGLADIQTIMQGYADETGRAHVLSAEMAEDIAAIGLGTGLGIEQATKLGAQFEIMGLDAKRSMEMVQGIVDTSERMGVSTTNVLKEITNNFKKINTFNFKAGSEGIAKMAMDAEKFKVSIISALSAAEKTRTLEGAIEAVAQLQVMGGEFAKLDMFETMYMSRNEPEKWNQKISEMTRGMVTFKKQSDGTFQKIISTEDRQRLEYAAKALGISNEEISEIAQRRGELDLLSKNLDGMGLTGREKELIEGATMFNSKSSKFEVQLAGKMRDVTTLTAEQAKSFAKESVALEKRAENAMDFETALKATIDELKASLLPMLNGINTVLGWIRPIAQGFNDLMAKMSNSSLGRGFLIFAGGIAAFGFIVDKLLAGFTSKGGITDRIKDRIAGGTSEKTGNSWRNIVRKKAGGNEAPMSSGRRAAGRGAGKGMAGAGAGIGAAALGVGAGIGAAAAGISLLATAMSKLDEKKVEALQGIVRSISIVTAIGVAAAAAVFIFGKAALIAAPGLGTFALAVLGVGAGIGIAAAGIGLMGMGMGKMFESVKGSGKELFVIAGGMAAMAAALGLFTLGGALGMPMFLATMAAITAASLSSALMARNLERMGTAMSGTKDDWIAVQNAITAISSANFKGGGMLADLANLLKKPLKVEFDKNKVQFISDITLEIDGQKFMQKIYKPNAALVRQDEVKNGQGSE